MSVVSIARTGAESGLDEGGKSAKRNEELGAARQRLKRSSTLAPPSNGTPKAAARRPAQRGWQQAAVLSVSAAALVSPQREEKRPSLQCK